MATPSSPSHRRPYTVADAILDTLKAHGVTHLFGYPGGAILPFYDALPSHPDIKHILVRNEQGAAFMAQGWARATKKIGVCCATSGPGATNLVTGIADAYMDSIPMLAITGQVPLPMIGKDMFQEVDMTGITLPITKHNYLLDDPKKTVFVITEAIAIALHGRPGPVHVDVPKDVMMSPHPEKFTIPTIDLAFDPMRRAYDDPPSEKIDRVMDILTTAKRPILLLGHGIKHAKAEKEALAFINALSLPTVTTILAKGVLPDNTPSYLGFLGMHGHYHSNRAMHEADVILNIGSRFDDRIVGRYDVFGKNATVIHVDIDKSEFHKVVHADLPVHADARVFLQLLLKHPKLRHLQIDPWREKIAAWRADKPYVRETKIFSMRTCLAAIDELVRKDPSRYIVVVDVGQHQMWAMLSCSVNSATEWLSSGGSGSMGFALPAAIGAAFARPEKTVLCITGDGGIQMNIQEMGVLADHPLDVKVLIMNNAYLGMVRQWQELFYHNNYSSVAITSPDYAILASAYHLPGRAVRSAKEMQQAHGEIFQKRGPYVIDYRVEKEDNVFPMVPGGKHLGETVTESDIE